MDKYTATEQAYKNGYEKGYKDATDNNVGSKWISVGERLPERNTEVLVCDTKEDYVSVWEYIGDGLWLGNEIIWATEDITHWMPLPEPPKEEKHA